MAKRRKSRKTTTRRRRRVGALSMKAGSPLMTYGSIAAGFFAGSKVNDLVMKVVPGTIDGKIVGAAEAGIGALLVFKGRKTLIKTVAGGVLLGAGVKKLLAEFGVMNGYGAVPVVGRRMNGYGAVPVVGAGFRPSKYLGGSLSGYNAPPIPAGHKQVIGSMGDEGGSGISADSRN